MATDGIIYPTKCEAWSFDGLRESLTHKDQFSPIRQQYNLNDIKVLGVVPTMYRGRTLEHQDNLRRLQDTLAVWFGSRCRFGPSGPRWPALAAPSSPGARQWHGRRRLASG